MKFIFSILFIAFVAAVSADLAQQAQQLHKEAKALLKEIETGPHPERKALLSNWPADFRTLECAFDDQCSVYIQDAGGQADLKLTIAKMEAQKKMYNDIFKGNYCKGNK